MTKAIARRCLANVLYIRHASSRTPDSGFMAVMVQPGSEEGVEAGGPKSRPPGRARTRSGGESAVHCDRGTGDVAAAVAGQVHDGPGDIVGQTVAAGRREPAQGASPRAGGGIH